MFMRSTVYGKLCKPIVNPDNSISQVDNIENSENI